MVPKKLEKIEDVTPEKEVVQEVDLDPITDNLKSIINELKDPNEDFQLVDKDDEF